MIRRNILFVVAVVLAFALVSGADFSVSSNNFQNSYSYSNPSSIAPDFQTYSSSSEISTYWPQLSEGQSCDARQDLVLQIAPVGCQPAVVRSDLLAEQNVPVFCQINAFQANPLIDIKSINNIAFSGNYPKEVVGTGFHPAKAALRTQNNLLGSPLLNNIGYVVVVLKKQPKESELPDKINLTLSAQVSYDSRNALGVGKASYLLEPMSDEEWNVNKAYSSFWQGRYFVRLMEVNEQGAYINIYEGDRVINSVLVKPGQSSSPIYVTGSYCSAGFQIAFDGFKQATDRAILEITDDKGTERLEVYNGQSFLNDKCRITGLNLVGTNNGNVQIRCSSSTTLGRSFKLELKENYNSALFDADGTPAEIQVLNDGSVNVFYNVAELSFGLNEKNEIEYEGSVGLNVISSRYDEVNWPGKKADSKTPQSDFKVWLGRLQSALIQYKQDYKSNPNIVLVNEKIWEDANIESNFSAAMNNYEKVFKEFSAEKEKSESPYTLGEEVLVKAIEFSRILAKDRTRQGLLETFIKLYPNSNLVLSYKLELEKIGNQDRTNSVALVDVDNQIRSIRLVSLEKPKELANAEFGLGNVPGTFKINYRESESKFANFASSIIAGTNPIVSVDRIENDKVYVSGRCSLPSGTTSGSTFGSDRVSRYFQVGESFNLCGNIFTLRNINSNEMASIRINPIVQGSGSKVNLSVTIGIEKRAIQLSPEKTKEMINNINESIDKWESISNNLGNVVKGMKAACFATSAILTFKNFMTGLSGETIARQKAMQGDNGWTNKCKKLLADKTQGYTSMDDCFFKNADNIQKDVDAWQKAIEQSNQQVSGIEKDFTKQTDVFGGLLGGDNVVDQEKAKKALIEQMKTSDCANIRFNINNEQKTLSDLLAPQTSVDGKDALSYVSYKELVDLNAACIAKKEGVNNDAITAELNKKASSISSQINLFKMANQEVVAGEPRAGIVNSGGLVKSGSFIPLDVVKTAGLPNKAVSSALSGYSEVAKITVIGSGVANIPTQTPTVSIKEGDYYLGLKAIPEQNGMYTIDKIVDSAGVEFENKAEVLKSYNIDIPVKAISSISLNNKYENPEVRFFETEPYKGMPAVVPVDLQRGFYAGTRQVLPVGGGIGAFDSSGRVTSFWLCNVGGNHLEEFERGYGDDDCVQYNLNTGQEKAFPGLTNQEAEAYIQRAQQAIMEAAQRYSDGVKAISLSGIGAVKVGLPAVNSPQTQCQDFMSPEDCHLMFNVCDPVICPNSRCNLGGAYPVADVVQTGIVGSILLCLPNVREGIFIPVCLTGVKAGIDSYLSILKNHRDCLQTSLDSGQMVGICDQLYSIYLCEFFWRQVAPVANILLPKLIESVYSGGQGAARGGGEYLTTMAAWQNMQKSIDYFTQSYAANSFKAFQIRSTEEAGSLFCKASISGKIPVSFDSLLEPDSPSQHYAWFSSTPYSTATLPATAQYKVFYHIFAGNDAGSYYSVYLKNPPVTSYYASSPTIQVASGFVAKGQYASQTKDFTAPEGYKELCIRVNEKENCGFKQVSTDFAVNYLRDKVAQEQIQNEDINSDSECVSGEPSANSVVGSVLTNTNPGSALDEAVNPQIYNRGIVRVCSTQNPGLSTEPTRYVRVGSCTDPKIGCWLDIKSVDKSITVNNIGVKNETLENLQQKQFEQLQSEGQLLKVEEASYQISLIRAALESSNNIIKDAPVLISRIEQIQSVVFMNNQKAQLFMLKGEVYDKVAKQLQINYLNSRNPEVKITKEEVTVDGVDNPSVANTDENTLPDRGEAGESGTATATTSVTYILRRTNDGFRDIIKINFDGREEALGFSISDNNAVYFNEGMILIGTVAQNNIINIPSTRMSEVPLVYKDFLISLNGARVESDKIVGISITSSNNDELFGEGMSDGESVGNYGSTTVQQTEYFNKLGTGLEFEFQDGTDSANVFFRFNGKNWEWRAQGGVWPFNVNTKWASVENIKSGDLYSVGYDIVIRLKEKSFTDGFFILLEVVRDYKLAYFEPTLATSGISFGRKYIASLKNLYSLSLKPENSTPLYQVLLKNKRLN